MSDTTDKLIAQARDPRYHDHSQALRRALADALAATEAERDELLTLLAAINADGPVYSLAAASPPAEEQGE